MNKEANLKRINIRNKIDSLDLSLDNPKVVSLIEKKILDWVFKHEEGDSTIPLIIEFEGVEYIPRAIYEEVQAKTTAGNKFLKQIDSYWKKQRFTPKTVIKNSVLEVLPKNDLKLDEFYSKCACGDHNTTYRDLSYKLLDLVPNFSLFVGISTAIKSLYDPSHLRK